MKVVIKKSLINGYWSFEVVCGLQRPVISTSRFAHELECIKGFKKFVGAMHESPDYNIYIDNGFTENPVAYKAKE